MRTNLPTENDGVADCADEVKGTFARACESYKKECQFRATQIGAAATVTVKELQAESFMQRGVHSTLL
jgi:hypothetical protein